MTLEAASYQEDVEQLRLRFMKFRKAHAVRSRLPEELWAAAAKLARRDGIEATARVLEVDRAESPFNGGCSLAFPSAGWAVTPRSQRLGGTAGNRPNFRRREVLHSEGLAEIKLWMKKLRTSQEH